MRKFIGISLLLISVASHNVYGATLLEENNMQDTLYIKYEVNKDEKESFFDRAEQIIILDGKGKYSKDSFEVTGGNETKKIDIEDTKEITTKTNSLEEILSNLPKSVEYNKDGFVGVNNLDVDSIEVTPIYNGYYEEYIEDTKQYFDLNKNDMDYIPKEITKDGYTLFLVGVDWYSQTKKFTGDIEITDLYRAEAHYKGVKRIYYPYTYKVIAKYKGTASKEVEKPYILTIKYNKVNEDKKINVVPIITGTAGELVIIILLLRTKRVKVYNLYNGTEKYLGSYKIKDKIIDLSNSLKVARRNKYKIVLNKRLYRKYSNKYLTLIKDDIKKMVKVESDVIEVQM